MSTLGSSGRVGAAVVVAGVLLTGMYIFFQGLNNTYPIDVIYPDATGTVAGEPVQLAGVKIGEVNDIGLTADRQADVSLKIYNKDKIPIGSTFRIVNPLLGGVGSIAVIPPLDEASGSSGSIPAGTKIKGQPTFDLAGTIGKSTVLIDSLTRTAKKTELVVDSLQQIIGDPRLKNGLITSAENISLASANGVKLTDHLNEALAQDNNALGALLGDTKKSADRSLSDVNATTQQIKEMTLADRGRFDEILSNLQDTTSAVAGITTETNESLKNGHLTDNLSAVVANLKSSTDHLNQIAANLQKFTGDPATGNDLKETIHNIRETTEQSAYLMARLNKLAGNKNAPPLNIDGATPVQEPAGSTGTDKPPAKASVSSIGISPRIDFLQNTAQDHFRMDANAIVSLGGASHSFGDVGVYGLGDSNHFNLQYGQGYGAGLDYRAGLYDSKLGVGADYGLAKNVTFSLDLYNPNHYMVDAKSVVMLNKSLGIVLGVDNVTRQAGGSIGIELRH